MPDELLPAWDAASGESEPESPVEMLPVAEPVLEPPPAADQALACAVCGAALAREAGFCGECGYMPAANPVLPPDVAPLAAVVLEGKYRLREEVGTWGGWRVWRGLPVGADPSTPPVLIALESTQPRGNALDRASLETTDDLRTTAPAPERSVPWLCQLLEEAKNSALPRVLDRFHTATDEVVVLEEPQGLTLWQAWNDPSIDMRVRATWLLQAAEALHAVHQAGALVLALPPEEITVEPTGRLRLSRVFHWTPFPTLRKPPLPYTPYAAATVFATPNTLDLASDAYALGAMLYALLLGRDLSETDFIAPGVLTPPSEHLPQLHPVLHRLLLRTLVPRPVSEWAAVTVVDPFPQLLADLREAVDTLDMVRFEVGGWSNVGMIREGNEDAFLIWHGTASHQNRSEDRVLAIVTDGMGGCAAGEVASAAAIATVVAEVESLGILSVLPGKPRPAGPEMESAVLEALRTANRAIHDEAHQPGSTARGMGCTAEVILLLGREAVIGHVGDSRTYHFSMVKNELRQVTRDQTFVNRLVEIGLLTDDEAAHHPRRHELQQALGGGQYVDPQVDRISVQPGDVLVACSDGVTNLLSEADLWSFLSAANSAEALARRLVLAANEAGGTDNATAVVIRVL